MPTQVLSGLGGTGKTQIAAEYATAVRDEGGVDLLVWLTASNRSDLLSAYKQAMFAIQDRESAEDEEAVAQQF